MNSGFLNSEQWKTEVVKMRDAYGAPLDDDTAQVIVRYLSATYGPGAPKS